MTETPPLALGQGDEYELRPADPDLGRWDEQTLAWRLKRFLAMGFPVGDAEELAAARCWTGDVEQLLARGCDHAQALAIAL